MSKIFEHPIHQHLIFHLEKIFHNSMFGYRKYHGYPNALLALLNRGRKILNNHNIIGIMNIAIDLSKPLTVNHMT